MIIQDVKEKLPWDFLPYGENQKIESLKTGDYTTDDLKDIFIVERKATTGELAINLGKKSKQFFAELKRMNTYKYKYVICEFSIHDLYRFPEGSGIPKKDWKNLRMNYKYITSCIEKIINDCNIEFFFCLNKIDAERKFLELYNDIKQRET